MTKIRQTEKKKWSIDISVVLCLSHEQRSTLYLQKIKQEHIPKKDLYEIIHHIFP